MQEFDRVLNGTDKAVFNLRALYDSFGYKKYRMSKFEKYDLYATNKDFLVSDNVITFTDTDGTLLALKPDVTLSIIKNGRDGVGVEKVYYNENVYRVSKGTKSFKELMQVGLECFGDIDDYCISEVLYLAVKSLDAVSNDYLLLISDLDLISGIIDDAGLSSSGAKKVISFLAEKNAQGIATICKEENVDDKKAELLKKLVTVYGGADKVLTELINLDLSDKVKISVYKLQNIISALESWGVKDKIKIDFSVVSDINYYNGIVFKGFVSGAPSSVLSGGQYDNLMEKMKRKDGAIGFAVYLDELEKLVSKNAEFDVDIAIEYADGADISTVIKKVKEEGKKVFVAKKIPENLTYKTLIKLEGGKK